MGHEFKRHYTVEEARALLPQIRAWLDELGPLAAEVRDSEEQLQARLQLGDSLGGEPVNHWLKCLAKIQRLLGEFQRRSIQIKDIDRGLIDFPAFVGGQEAFLCWEKDEDDIEFWHSLESGYAGRERLD